MNELYLELKNKIESAQSIIVFSHVSPDGDTLGSNLAISILLEQHFQKKVDSAFVGIIPTVYGYLPHFDRFKEVSSIDRQKKYDLAIAVDVASKDRLVSGIGLFDNAKCRVNIDHHKTNTLYGDLNIVDGNAACVGVILFRIFREWGVEIPFDVARCIYTSLLTDTGGFRYENAGAECFLTAAELIKLGVSPMKEYRACFETKPQAMVKFQAYIVSNAIFCNNGKIAVAKVSRADMSKFDANDEYTEGIVEVLRAAKDVEVAAILKETKEGWTKISLRSKNIDIIPVVLDFGGGGHTFAAGCTIKKPVPIAFDKLLQRIQNEIDNKKS